MIRQRYDKGNYHLREDLPYTEAVRDLIVTQSFRDYETTRLHVHPGRKRSVLFTFHFPPAEKELVMKVARTTGDYPLSRRIELYLKSLFNDYSKAAFEGALALEEAGIATGRPVAYWTCRTSLLKKESYFLYEKIEAECTARELRSRVATGGTPEDQQAVSSLEEQMSQITRRLHGHGLRHGDIHSENFLVSLASAAGAEPQQSSPELSLYLIDTDRVTRTRLSIPVVKRFFDLRCLCKLDFSDDERKQFLKRYLGDDYSPFWWRVLTFWRNGGFGLSARRKRRKARSRKG